MKTSAISLSNNLEIACSPGYIGGGVFLPGNITNQQTARLFLVEIWDTVLKFIRIDWKPG
jgi:hypothetical protein